MFKFKVGFIGLVFFSIFLYFLLYFVFVTRTFELKNRYSFLVDQKEKSLNSFKRLSSLKKKELYLDSILDSRGFSVKNSFQQVLLRKITSFIDSNSLEIESFISPHLFYQSDKTLNETYIFSIKGDFINILKFLDFLEKQKLGMLFSVSFKKEVNYNNRNKKYLKVTVFLQRITI